MSGKRPLSIYVHIPFCRQKCSYCSFCTVPWKKDLMDLYCTALIQEGLTKIDASDSDYIVETLFIGGGTPSTLPIPYLKRIINLAPQASEITVEANPEDITHSYIEGLLSLGVNRISIGIQSFNDHILKLLHRSHDVTSAIRSINVASQTGLSNISIDLIYGLPQQNFDSFKNELSKIDSLPIKHLSLYNLTIDPHTSFYKNRSIIEPTIASQYELSKMSTYAHHYLDSLSFKRYEIGSYAQHPYSSKHNIGYWTDREFLGLGVSASQYLKGIRSKNTSQIMKYISNIRKNNYKPYEEESLPLFEKVKENLALRLRLIEGAKIMDFPKKLIKKILQNPILKDFLIIQFDKLCLTERGLLFHDTVAEEIMGLEEEAKS